MRAREGGIGDRRRGRGRASRAARALLGLGLVAALVAGGAYRSATAQVRESLQSLGVQMMAYAHATHQDLPRQLRVNGQTLHLSSGTTRRPASEVLDYFEGRCAEEDGGLGAAMERLARDHPEGASDAPDAPTIREDGAHGGYVACLDLGRESVDVAELGRRLVRFGETGDVSEIGDARYVFAEESERDGVVTTHFVGLWTEGSFDVGRMFPREGDAPGRDPEGLSRPPESRRVLQGRERGMPQSMTVYESARSPEALEAFYRRDLPRRGWTLLPLDEARRPRGAPATLIAERGPRMVTLLFQPAGEAGGSTAAIFDSP